MGQLDDAIREHLELKRRRGADPTDVAREEQEALGPVRREAEPALEPVEVESDLEPPEREEPDPGGDPAEEETRLHRAEPADVPAAVRAEPELEPEDDFEWDPLERRSAPGASEPTEEHIPEPADEADGEEPHAEIGEDDEDVLEETPDFLQETPEHDRLWFEQRPPRDFDWDK